MKKIPILFRVYIIRDLFYLLFVFLMKILHLLNESVSSQKEMNSRSKNQRVQTKWAALQIDGKAASSDNSKETNDWKSSSGLFSWNG